MFHDFQLILDPPPHGFYTYEDTVSGKVVFSSSHEEKVGWVYVFFHGWIHAQITSNQQNHYNQDRGSRPFIERNTDKEVLFQNHLKLYEGYEKLHKKVRYEWPFRFSFQEETYSSPSLPSSGKYSFTDQRNAWSSVDYKVVAVHGEIGQSDDHIRWMLNLNDLRYQKDPALKPTGILLKLREKTGGAAEQQLLFAQIRPSQNIEESMAGPISWDLKIAEHHLPQLAYPPEYGGRSFGEGVFPFSIDLQIPRNIIIGVPFSLLLNVSSKAQAWIENPPPVTLTSFKMQAYAVDYVTIDRQHDLQLKTQPIWEGKRLHIPLGFGPQQVVDIGKIYTFCLVPGDRIVPSFNAQCLQRKYDFPVELTVEVGGKTLKAVYAVNDFAAILSPIFATGGRTAPEKENMYGYKQDSKKHDVKVELQGTHTGRINQDGAGPLRENDIMEAAIALSRALTEAQIPHFFPGGNFIKLLPHNRDGISDHRPNSALKPDSEQIQHFFGTERGPFRTLPTDQDFVPSLYLGFANAKYGKDIVIEFPDLLTQIDESSEKFSDNKKGFANSVNLDPVSLFNYRLRSLAMHETFGEPEIGDIDPLFKAFTHHLQVHRMEINVNYAKVALRRHPTLQNLYTRLGVDLRSHRKDREDIEVEEEQLPPYEAGLGYGYEQDLVNRAERNFHLRDENYVPKYEAGSSKSDFSNRK